MPPSLTEIAADPGAQRGLHVRIRHCGMGTLPAMESLVDRRDQFRREAAARADAPAVTEQPAYRDWATAARTILAELPRDLLHDRFALHWELVDREVPGGRTRPRIGSATGSLAEVLDIDRQVTALQADPLAPAGPAERPWTKREHVKDGPAYDTFFKRVEALRKQAPREGDVPLFLVEAAGAFRQWSADRTAIAEPLGVLSAAVQRQRQLLARAGTGDQPFQETAPDLHRQWREEADRIKQARRAFARAWRGYRKRHHAPIRPLPGDPTAYRSGVRILETLPSLAALPARTLLEWHDAMTAKSADDGDWYRSDTCGTMRHAWRRLDRSAAADDPGREDDARRLRDLDEAAGLFRHEHFIGLVRELREQDGSDTWLADPGTPDWSSTVLYQEQEACAFLGDTATRERLSKRFPRVTEKLSNDLQFVSNALDPLREEFRLRAARQAEQDAIDDEIVKRERKREAREREAWERSLDQEPVRKPESPSRTQAPAPIRTPGNDWGYGR